MDEQLLLDIIISTIGGDACTQQFDDCVGVLASLHGKRLYVERAYNRHIRELAKEKVIQCADAGLFSDCDSILHSIDMMLRIDHRDDFDAYMQSMEWNRAPEKRFWQPRRRCLMPACMALQDLFDGRLRFLSVSLPPRTGKTTMCIFFLSMVMGSNPDDSSAMGGYNDELAGSFHSEVLSLVEDRDGEYRFAEIFPDAEFKGKSLDKKTVDLRARHTRFHTLFCRGVGGTWTGSVEIGRKGLLYCDDLVKKREESLNSALMDKLYSAYMGEMRDRMLPGGRQLFIGTRWVPNDPIGRIEAAHDGDPEYRFFCIPALDDDGNSNFLYDMNPFDAEYYTSMRDDLIDAGDEDEWWAKYMCRPYWREGALYEAGDLNYFGSLPTDDKGEILTPDAIIAVCDTKSKGPDYCVMPICYVYGDRHYVVDVVCSDSSMEIIQQEIVLKLIDHRVQVCMFESNAAGGTVAYDVGNECRLQGLAIDIRTKYSTENKETRIEFDAGWVKQRCVFRADRSREYSMFMKFLTSYTLKGKNKHDDVPDAMSLYKRFIDSTSMARVEPVKRLF